MEGLVEMGFRASMMKMGFWGSVLDFGEIFRFGIFGFERFRDLGLGSRVARKVNFY